MSYKVITEHNKGLVFNNFIDGHMVAMGSSSEENEDFVPPSPKKLLLGNLATCSAIDVVMILKKMKVEYSDFSIESTAELTEDIPNVFSSIHLIYKIKTEERNRAKVEKAVKLSKEKYCGVSAMLEKNNPIHYEIQFL